MEPSIHEQLMGRIMALEQQRNMAMDQVVVLSGNIHHLTEELARAKAAIAAKAKHTATRRKGEKR